MLTTVLQAVGLTTNLNKLSVQAGGLVQADDVVIDKKDVIETRRGFNPTGTTFAFAGKPDNIFNYQNKLIVSNGSALAYDSDGAQTWTSYSGTFVPPTGANKIHAISGANKNFYFTTTKGIYKLDSVTGTPFPAGGPKALDGTGVQDASGSGWFLNNSNVAYQIVFGYTDANGNLILGDPSMIINVTNTSGSTQNVNMTFTVPSGLTTSYFWQLYRSAQTGSTSVAAGIDFQLVAQANLTSGQISALQVTYTDKTPENLKGAFLYTDATQQGPFQTNDPPPLALDVCYWKGMAFYLNVQTQQQAFTTIISVGSPNGVQVNDTFIITSGVTTLTYTAKATNNFASHQFGAPTGGTPAENIDATARNLVACINQDSTNSLVYAYYVSGFNQLPGQILIQERAIGGAVFYLTSSRGGAYSPALPTSGTTYPSSNNSFPNGVYVSKVNQPEAVPLVNLFFVGAGDQAGFRILPLTDAVYVLKQDGVFRITGDDPSNLVVTIAYPDTLLTAPETAVVLNNNIYAYTNQGVLVINQSEPQLVSFEIEDQLFHIQEFTNFANFTFGVSYPSDRKFIMGTMTESDDTGCTQNYVYNYITRAWTRWVQSYSSGFFNPTDQKLYFSSPTLQKIAQERKSFTVFDYADRSFPVTISSFTGKTVVVNSTTNAVVGYSLAQPGTSPNFPITSVITAIVNSTTLTVSDTITWGLGAAEIYTPIPASIQYAPAHAGLPLYLKHWQTLIFDIDNLTADQITGGTTSDLSSYLDSFTLRPQGLGFGLDGPFGLNAFGVRNPALQPIRVLVPINKARSHWIGVSLTQSQALTKFSLNGTSAEFDVTSTRMH